MTKRVVVRLPSGDTRDLDVLLDEVAQTRQICAEVEEAAVTAGRRSGVSWGFMAGRLGLSERGLAKRYRGV